MPAADAAPLVGFCGLGAMGFHIAGHLSKVLHRQMLVWNRTPAKAVKHAEAHGTTVAKSLQELRACDVLFTCLPESSHVLATVKGILQGGGQGGGQAGAGAERKQQDDLNPNFLVVDCTSGDYLVTREIGALVQKHGGRGVVDAPVSGGPAGAQAGKLSVIVGAKARDLEKVRPLLLCFAKAITHCGPVGAGHAVKSVNNVLNTTHLLAATEGLVGLKAVGVDPAVALKAINQSSGRSLMTEVRIPKEVLEKRYGYGFKLGLMLKDVNLANKLLDTANPGAKLLRVTNQRTKDAVEEYGYDGDYSLVARMVEDEAGISLGPDDVEDRAPKPKRRKK